MMALSSCHASFIYRSFGYIYTSLRRIYTQSEAQQKERRNMNNQQYSMWSHDAGAVEM